MDPGQPVFRDCGCCAKLYTACFQLCFVVSLSNLLINCLQCCRQPTGDVDDVMTGLHNNLIAQRFKLNNKVALITGKSAVDQAVVSALVVHAAVRGLKLRPVT